MSKPSRQFINMCWSSAAPCRSNSNCQTSTRALVQSPESHNGSWPSDLSSLYGSLTSFIDFASLIIPLRQKAISWQNIWSSNAGFRSFSSTMSLPSLPLKDGNAIPLVSVSLNLLPVLTPVTDRFWNRHSLV